MSAFHRQALETFPYNSGDASSAPMSFRNAGFACGAMELNDAIIKRVADVVLALAGLALMGIPMFLAAVVIRLSSKGPALFRQERIGLNGRRFVMLKFRTMLQVAEHPGRCLQATRHDPRVTRIGAVLRHTSFDELPQLLNVLEGSMSLVGPRPHAPGTCVAGRPFEAITDQYVVRQCVKPGMTGLAQVRGWRGETDTEEKFFCRIGSDLEYIANWSLRRDFLIILRTIATVLRMPNAY